MLKDDDSVLVSEGWSLWTSETLVTAASAICGYIQRTDKGYHEPKVLAFMKFPYLYHPCLFPAWTKLEKHLEYPENPLRWYLWIPNQDNRWEAELWRERHLL